MAKVPGSTQVARRGSAPGANGLKIKIPTRHPTSRAWGTLNPALAPRSDPEGDLYLQALPANGEARCGCLETVSMTPRSLGPWKGLV